MKITKFKECNSLFGENKDVDEEVPAFLDRKTGNIVTCYKVSFKDIFKILFNRRIWVRINPHGRTLQPKFVTSRKKI